MWQWLPNTRIEQRNWTHLSLFLSTSNGRVDWAILHDSAGNTMELERKPNVIRSLIKTVRYMFQVLTVIPN